jgi:hypothetical protein
MVPIYLSTQWPPQAVYTVTHRLKALGGGTRALMHHHCARVLQTYGYQREQAARASMMTFLEVPFAYLLQVRI